jgi:hypothetical protein
MVPAGEGRRRAVVATMAVIRFNFWKWKVGKGRQPRHCARVTQNNRRAKEMETGKEQVTHDLGQRGSTPLAAYDGNFASLKLPCLKLKKLTSAHHQTNFYSLVVYVLVIDLKVHAWNPTMLFNCCFFFQKYFLLLDTIFLQYIIVFSPL